ncbi:MAG: hypothetical protein ACTSW1_12560 [Candidatus Hodarchaeales archaeon]
MNFKTKEREFKKDQGKFDKSENHSWKKRMYYKGKDIKKEIKPRKIEKSVNGKNKKRNKITKGIQKNI